MPGVEDQKANLAAGPDGFASRSTDCRTQSPPQSPSPASREREGEGFRGPQQPADFKDQPKSAISLTARCPWPTPSPPRRHRVGPLPLPRNGRGAVDTRRQDGTATAAFSVRGLSRPLLAAAVIALAACTTPPRAGAYYAPPQGSGAGGTTAIMGTRFNPAWWKAYYEYAYVWAVDDLPVANAEDTQWRQPLVLPAGGHKLTVMYQAGGLSASYEFIVECPPNRREIVKYDVYEPQGAMRMWIEDAETGVPLTDKPVIRTIGAATPGAGGVIPIFIHHR